MCIKCYLPRVKSFFWRLGMVILATSISWSLDNLELLELPSYATVIFGLFLGEVSKELNNRYGLKKQ
jgi:hypothetical protein